MGQWAIAQPAVPGSSFWLLMPHIRSGSCFDQFFDNPSSLLFPPSLHITTQVAVFAGCASQFVALLALDLFLSASRTWTILNLSILVLELLF
jgi:hypothetical protein